MPLLPLFALALASAQAEPQQVPLQVLPSGLLQHMGGVRSQAVTLTTKRPSSVRKVEAKVTQLCFGKFFIGGEGFLIARGMLAGRPVLLVDAKRDGDLLDNPHIAWRPATAHSNASGEAAVRLEIGGTAHMVSVLIVQSSAKRLAVLPDYGFHGSIDMGGKKVPFLLADDARHGFPNGSPVGGVLGLDRRGTGVIGGAGELYAADQPFTVSGVSLVLQSVDLAHLRATFVPGEHVAEVILPASYQVGQPCPHFETKTFDGKAVHFPDDYAGVVVLVYAWATWSKPSLEWLSRVEDAYQTHRGGNFTVLGICLNRAAEGPTASDTARQMPWPTGFDGQSWAGPAVKALGLQTVPFLLLVDGRTGKVLATMDQMVGSNFGATIRGAIGR